MTTDFDADQVVRDVTAAVRKKFPEQSEEQVTPLVREELAGLVDRPVQDYLSVLTERAVKRRLKREKRDGAAPS
ncbi:three-helix bundle dimerization domain-containing protein [Rathayibacter iranicus]|uniref:Uncharacterized protein n=2 Tax=Rathayibacter iranicus TaxID=59737 RepID=A0AAD1AGY9_9MICO|nr:hypothetical protein [Rathayibacter iranicus]AZZ56424.1 hypothetical protein C7V51_11450 [Rathayibacter iranicus]MWV31799.1 hypothetical protein [Rathayibacter iranicus NCPPB 2253 = VKM Ac-1602]PPI44872.1 hypothetical protein C5E09_10370 [Rathayibacter iranicus]PPI59106.1 hypothetical protein C5E08_11305 [Rathayibacter iranicus]PPI70323.1 hypothetical protein C5E01_10345 [Rathayibacter iranicus]